ncbi:MAG: hypothetical protein KKF33_08780 [Alphaproteobacteria bacterium]|nr:hypothetical protein [Alphaproteobacteria bacterium]
MADYKELLRRAISALPENNGAARRAVYEKARSALVGQLRAITPPLPARDITQHRLQLEDCIRQVEQEASEAVIMLGREMGHSPRPVEPRQPSPQPEAPAVAARPMETAVSEPRPFQAKAPDARPFDRKPFESKPVDTKPAEPVAAAETAVVAAPVQAASPAAPPASQAASAMSIEEIIEQAATVGGASVTPTGASNQPADKPATAVVPPRTEPIRREPFAPASNVKPLDISSRATPFEPRRNVASAGPAATGDAARASSRVEPSIVARPLGGAQQAAVAVVPALSSIREVELEVVEPDTIEAEGAIERAIETLDREARGELTTPIGPAIATAAETAPRFGASSTTTDTVDDSGFSTAANETRATSGLTIFLIVFAVLLVGVGGAGFWAWREGYIPVDQMFSQAQPAIVPAPTAANTPTLDPASTDEAATDAAASPGNTATATVSGPATTLEGLEPDLRLEPTPETVVPTGNETVLPALGGEGKGEERLPGQDATQTAANDPAASVDPAVLAGSQSLLLEASATGTTGAVPFSGTVEWSEGVDELGLPTILAHASIPARNLGVNFTIRKNSDPSLPASHLMEVDFQVSDSFIGGTIASLPGVLLKNEELVAGTPLVGASARVMGNSFLFALSASPEDASNNTSLLENNKWIDLAIVYGTGRNAIVTIEKDADAEALFKKVFTAWAK